MEKEILDIITRIAYSDKINELYNTRSTEIEFPTKINLDQINFKVLSDFNDDYFSKYENTLIENALIYVLTKNETKYLTFFKKHINSLKKTIDEEKVFRIKTTEYAIKNIINKKIHNINLDDKIKNSNKDLFTTIEKIYRNIEPLTALYRRILFETIEYVEEKEEFIHLLINSTELDNKFIELNNNLLSRENINKYKSIITRIILGDVYLNIVSSKQEDEIDDFIKEINKNFYRDNENEYDDDEYDIDIDEDNEYDNMIDVIEEEILNFINSCIKNNIFYLPPDNKLRNNILSNFITYNMYTDKNERTYDIETLEQDNSNTKSLKKINPLYKLDIIDLNK